ncbi:MAG: universal stress protein [Myxococcota bacterium]
MKLLLAIDIHHHNAEAVVAEGGRWARSLGGRLDLVYVDEDAHDAAYGIRDPEIQRLVVQSWGRIQDHHRAALDELIEILDDDVRGQARYVQGEKTHEELVAIASGYQAILVFTHGRRGLGHLFMGSVAERLVRHATVPVMVLRLQEAMSA